MRKRELFTIFIIVLTACMIFTVINYKKPKENSEMIILSSPADNVKTRNLCMANLRRLNVGLRMYLLDFGRKILFPDANGGAFLARLYQKGILEAPSFYICPSTEDLLPDKEKLKKLGSVRGGDGIDSENLISYAGRKNADCKSYPGIFKPYRDRTLTPIASDDWQKSPNHENGARVHLLFLDEHVSFERNEEAAYKNEKEQYLLYAKGQGKRKLKIADPLTN